MSTNQERTAQDLLADRRFNVDEMRRSCDPTARENLVAHIAILDAELAVQRASESPAAYARGRARYLDSEPMTACACLVERDGWLDARDAIREDAREPEDTGSDPLDSGWC